MAEASAGKDSVTGHWEIAGIVLDTPFPTFPHGFPADVMREFESRIGRGTLGNVAASGTEIIERLGAEHVATGKPIVYTSADSVFQIAAHEDVIPVPELYRICDVAYELAVDGLGLGRVIARPFVGAAPHFTRTANRHDYAMPPIADTLLDHLTAADVPVIAIGKIGDLFAGRGITRSHPTKSDAMGMDLVDTAIDREARGLIFVNLVDFDTQYGHRNDPGRLRLEPRALRRPPARAAASSRPGRPARHHRGSRQRPDDAEHGPCEGVRAAAGDGNEGAPRESRHQDDLQRPWPDHRRELRRAAAVARHELPRGHPRMTLIRQQLEAREREILAPQSARSADTRGRLRPEAEDDIRPAFQRDRDRVIHSKAFRRLKHKTQVFFSPAGDHYRTRLTHTLEVSQIARTIAKVLHLHEELTEAIALGHDLGHTPFGHAGERVLDDLVPGGFNHYEQSLRVVDVLENDGRGPQPHVGSARRHREAFEREGRRAGRRRAVEARQHPRRADCARGGSRGLRESRHRRLRPRRAAQGIGSAGGVHGVLGHSSSERIGTMVADVVYETLKGDLTEIRMGAEVLDATLGLREFLFGAVYENEIATQEFKKAHGILAGLWEKVGERPEVYLDAPTVQKEGLDAARRDFIAGMTDRYAVALFEELYIPRPWLGR